MFIYIILKIIPILFTFSELTRLTMFTTLKLSKLLVFIELILCVYKDNYNYNYTFLVYTCRQGDEMKVFGAGLLSSAAELEFVMQGIQVSIKPMVSPFL